MTWLHLPSTCLPSAPDTAASSLECPVQPGDVLTRSATWKGKPRQLRFWSIKWRVAPWLRRLSGVTLQPSTAARGVESWISSLRAIRASQNLQPENEPVPMMSAGSGRRSRASSAKSSPRSFSLRTSQPTLPGLSGECLMTLPRSGSMSSGVVYQRQRLAPPTSASGFTGSLPTPTASDRKASGSAGYSTESGRHAGMTLTDAVVRGFAKLPTPTAKSYGSNQGGAAGRTGKVRHSLDAMARMGKLPTPQASDGLGGPRGVNATKGFRQLKTLAAQGKLPTTTASAGTRGKAVRGKNAQGGPSLGESVTGPGRRLNPRFVEWMMGIPPDWLRLS